MKKNVFQAVVARKNYLALYALFACLMISPDANAYTKRQSLTLTTSNVVSTSGTAIPSATQITDASRNTWTVTAGVIYKDGNLAGYSQGVIKLLYLDNVIYQENGDKNWWSWNGSGWDSASNPLGGAGGVCGASNGTAFGSAPTGNLCATGTASTVSGTGPWSWTCKGTGIDVGTGVSCSAPSTIQASPSGTTIPSATQIVDSSDNIWKVSGGVIYENGNLAGYSNSVIKLLYLNNVIYQENAALNWWLWNGSGWASTGNPVSGTNGACGAANNSLVDSAPTTGLCAAGTASAVSGTSSWTWTCAGSNGGTNASCSAPPANQPSASGTTIPSATQIVDSGHNLWTVSSGVIYENGNLAGYSNGVIELLYLDTVIYQENGDKNWWSWNGSGWATASNPIGGTNGVCGASNGTTLGSAPSANLCSVGQSSPISGTGPWSWTCAGLNGGNNAACAAALQPVAVNGSCGSANGGMLVSAPTTNLCSTGSASTIAGYGPWTWSCVGANGGTNSSCSASVQTADTIPPTTPTGLNATASSQTQISLYWMPSTDNVGVAGYKVYRNGTEVGTSPTASYNDIGLSQGVVYAYTVSAYDAAGNNSPQSAAVSASPQTSQTSQATAQSKMGINLDYVTDWGDRAMMFVDVMKIARGFGTPLKYYDPTNYPVPLDANGWPTADFGVLFISNPSDPLNRPLTTSFPSMFGTYNVSFTGQATVNGADCCQVQNVVYNAQTNTTTGQVVVGPNDSQVALTFTNTNGGVQNLKLLRPGYPIGTTQVFTTQLMNALAPFSTMRFMTPLETNDSTVTSWSQRTLPSTPSQAQPNGIAWEYVIQLANATGKDIWINVPAQVDLTDTSANNYVTQLAQLMKSSLNPAIHVYVEYSNEVWNGGAFQQFQENLNSAVSEVNSGADSTLNYDNSGNQYYWGYRRTAHQSIRISNLFQAVYGASATNTTIRTVLMGQYVQPALTEDSLIYITKNFGAPSQYLYGIGGAPYFEPAGAYTDLDSLFPDLLQALNVDLPGFMGGMQYNGTVNWATPSPSFKTLADFYDLKSLSYEGGLSLGDGYGNSPTLSEQSLGDTRNNQLVQEELADWLGCGNDLFMYFELASTPGDYYGLYEDLSLTTPKSSAIATVSATPLSSYNSCSSTVTTSLYIH